jgi:pyrroloquinoline quinone biosynthesis protein D
MNLDAVWCIPPRFRLQFEPAQSAWVLLYPEGMVKLSPSAAEILRRVDGTATLDALCKSIEDAFPGASVRQDVIDFLKVADEHGWIVPRS